MSGLTKEDFDYGDLPQPEQDYYERQALKFRDSEERQWKLSVEAVLKRGEILADVHSRLANHKTGIFNAWVTARLGITPRHARNYLAAFDKFGHLENGKSFPLLEPTSLYLLSQPSCPEPARAAVLKLAYQKPMDHADVKAIVDRHSAKPAGYSPHGTGKKAPKAKNGASCFTDVTQEKRSEAAASVALDGDTHPVDPPVDPQPWPGDGEPDEADAPSFAAPVVVETTAKTVAQPTDDLWLRDQLLPLFRAALKLSDSLVKASVAKCLEDAVTMLSTGEPLEELAPVKAATANEITAEPSVMSFDITPHKKGACAEWGLSQAYVDELQEVFVGVDVLVECRKARLWCANNPTKRKTAKGMREFLRRWIEKQQNSSGGRASSRSAGPTSVVDDYLREFGGQE